MERTELTDLRKLIRRVERRRGVGTLKFRDLDGELQEHGIEGKVVSIVVYSGHGSINCYGHRIASSLLFDGLNLTIGTHGTRLTGTVTYPDISRLRSHRKGYFVRAERFGGSEAEYVALVNIPLNPENSDNVIPYRL